MTDPDISKELKRLAAAIIAMTTSFVQLFLKLSMLAHSALKLIYAKVEHELDLQRIAYPLQKQVFLSTLAPRLALYGSKIQLEAERARRVLVKFKNKPLRMI